MQLNKQQVIEQLQLEKHVEGGYFRRTFAAEQRAKVPTERGPRLTLSSIFYLLTDDAPTGHWHLNQSDIVHYYHGGSPVDYYLIDEAGQLNSVTLGHDLLAGQQLQLVVTGGIWKASHLKSGEYGLISEAVAPGFDFSDMTLGKRQHLTAQFPQYRALIERFTHG